MVDILSCQQAESNYEFDFHIFLDRDENDIRTSNKPLYEGLKGIAGSSNVAQQLKQLHLVKCQIGKCNRKQNIF
jgi:hypothetical protein